MSKTTGGPSTPTPEDGAYYFGVFCFHCARLFPLLPSTPITRVPNRPRQLSVICPHCERDYPYETIDFIPYQHDDDAGV